MESSGINSRGSGSRKCHPRGVSLRAIPGSRSTDSPSLVPGNRHAPIFESRKRWNDQFEQRGQIGAELDGDLLQMAVPAPPDLADQLPPRPRYMRYVMVGDHIVLLDRWNTMRDIMHLEKQPDGTTVPTR